MNRPDEGLDVEAVHAWLTTKVEGLEGTPQVTQFAGGASNWTYGLRYASHDLVLRRPPAGTKAKSAHDMTREYTVQQGLKPVYPYVPAMVALCTDESVLGTPFYVMERVDGLIPRARLPTELQLDAKSTRALCLSVWDRLVELHAVDPVAAGLASLGRGPGYARRQVDGWSDRYEKARTWNVTSFRRVRDWLKAYAPDDVASCVIHNDWRLDNVVLDRQNRAQVVAVLDWEMATIGDPLMDLGSALAYWVQADDPWLLRLTRRQPSDRAGMLTRREVVAHYAQRTGRGVGGWTFYEVFGLFRLAVIAQQIYYRYHHGQTRNRAFRHFWFMVDYLDWRCRQALRGRA